MFDVRRRENGLPAPASDTLLPGEIRLAEQRGVSRSVVREALRMLSAKRRLESRPKAGTRVRDRQHWNLLDPHLLAWMRSRSTLSIDPFSEYSQTYPTNAGGAARTVKERIMAGPLPSDVIANANGGRNGPNSALRPRSKLGLALICITALFFIWAFVTNLIDPLVKSMKVIYTLSDFETQLNQFAFFIAYGIMSIPSAWYLARRGYANSIIVGLLGVIAGCLIAWSTTFSHSFITVLLGLFVAASGITLLQVAANPLIASMGDPKQSHFRLNLSQAFNSLGAYLGGTFGAAFLLRGDLFAKNTVLTQGMKDEGLSFVTNVYLMIAIALGLFTVAVFMARRTIATHAPRMAETLSSPLSALRSKWANLGSIAIFLYVGAEVCVISGMIFFLEQRHVLNVPSQIAGYIAPLFMLLAMVGRFGGSVLLRYVKATTMLSLAGAGASLLCVIVMVTHDMAATPLGGTVNLPGGYAVPLTMGFIPAVAAIALGLMNSIMFPTIFTLTLERSTAPASATSGLMCLAICGGGFISILYGAVIDQLEPAFPEGARSLAFLVPLGCYLYVLWYALAARKAPTHVIEEVAIGH